MNQHLQTLLTYIQQDENLSEEQKSILEKSIKDVSKELDITLFKLDRTEKVKRTTAILLEETIEELEQKRKAIEQSNEALQHSLEELKAAQAQLVQSEKMASLGELTAGIAHEIQNPLNFVNNFSEVSRELIDELKACLPAGKVENGKLKVDRDEELINDILNDLDSNLEKINNHGKRADGIVKGMLQHSRRIEGQKELTDINVLCDEYLRLSYHGLRAKDKSFNATVKTDFDESIGKINIVPQDIGRVIMNLLTNAFYAVNEKAQHETRNQQPITYNPTVSVSTKKNNNNIQITVSDNGSGIPPNIIDKIFQPFFTTKPTGQGTGLGLSLAYDIIKAHGALLNVETEEGKGTRFIIII